MRDWAIVSGVFATLIILLAIMWYTRKPRVPLACIGNRNFDVYVINLKDNEARMTSFMRAYETCDLAGTHSVIRYDAVNGKQLELPEYITNKALAEILAAERTGYRTKHYQLTRGGIGCFLSHVGLWRSILDTDKNYAMIFEDDCVPAVNIREIMNSSVPHLADWDLCLLGYFCNDCDDRPDYGTDTIGVYRFFGLHCYMISRRGIKKILADPRSTRIHKQIDHVLADMCMEGSLRVIALESPVAWQNNAEHATTIQMPLREIPGIDANE